MSDVLRRLGVRLPILQAPMASVSTPAMAAAVANAGGLGALGVGFLSPEEARAMIREVRAETGGAFNVNVFCHRPAVADRAREAAWIARLAPEFERFGAKPPAVLGEIYRSFVEDDGMLAMLLEERPPVVSFHFGLPPPESVDALRRAGITLLASATSLREAGAIAAAKIDAIVAQGYEAGGHRGVFDPAARDECLSTMALTRLLTRRLDLPVIASGGIMDGSGIAACLRLGAVAAQLGTAFVACPESSADVGFRTALLAPGVQTMTTRAISGRPARTIVNRFATLVEHVPDADVPAYPIAYDAGKQLNAAAKAAGEYGFGAQWAGQGAPLARALPATELIRVLQEELARDRG